MEKKPRLINKNTATWQLFESVFLAQGGKDQSGGFVRLLMPSRGRAINTAMGMNTCNMQHHREQGIPLELSDICAKPVEDVDGRWWVTIVESFRHRHHKRKNAELDEILAQARMQEVQPLEREKKPPASDALFEAMLKGEK